MSGQEVTSYTGFISSSLAKHSYGYGLWEETRRLKGNVCMMQMQREHENSTQTTPPGK